MKKRKYPITGKTFDNGVHFTGYATGYTKMDAIKDTFKFDDMADIFFMYQDSDQSDKFHTPIGHIWIKAGEPIC